MKIVAFRAPKQEPLTMRANIREPMGPRTRDPKATAMVVEVDVTLNGRVRK